MMACLKGSCELSDILDGAYYQEVLRQMKALGGKPEDQEVQHIKADEILCEFLDVLGFRELVFAYRHVWKWYA